MVIIIHFSLVIFKFSITYFLLLNIFVEKCVSFFRIKGPCTLSPNFLYAFFGGGVGIRHPFLSKCLLQM